MKSTYDDPFFDVFLWGVDYGQLLMEEERDSEDLLMATMGSIYAKKTSMPMGIVEKRQPHSQKWRDAKKKGLTNFLELCKERTKRV